MLDYSREFIVLAERLNYASAAEHLHMSTSALSRHIADLEQELEFPSSIARPSPSPPRASTIWNPSTTLSAIWTGLSREAKKSPPKTGAPSLSICFPAAQRSRIFKRHDTFSVSPCMCRMSTLIREGKAKTTQEAMELFNAEMRDCGHPMETCICTGKNAERQIEIGAGREITAEEAIAILENSVKEGMIIETVYTKDAENICSCHADCCLNVGGIRALNGGPAVTKNYSNFTLMHKKDECIKCGMCEKQCPMYAITMDDEGYPIVDSACVRCGQCATVCPQGVRGLKLKPEEELPYIPQTLEEDYELKAHVRISKGYLYDITSQDEMKEIADAVAQA